MAKARQLKQSTFGPAVATFLQLAYKAYIAARVLILAGLLPQGAALASTAVEKALKVLFAFRGMECHGHLHAAHVNNAIDFAPWLAPHLDRDYIELLRRAYELRYADALQGEFNLVIASREFLAELDEIVLHILERCKLRNEFGPYKYGYLVDEERREPRLLTDNYLLNNMEKRTFIAAAPEWVYEFRQKARGHVPLEVSYLAHAGQSDGKFLREALVPLGPSDYKLAFKVIPPDSRLLVASSGLVLRPDVTAKD